MLRLMPTVHRAVDSGPSFTENSTSQDCLVRLGGIIRPLPWGTGGPGRLSPRIFRVRAGYPLNNNPLPTSYPQMGKTCGFQQRDRCRAGPQWP